MSFLLCACAWMSGCVWVSVCGILQANIIFLHCWVYSDFFLLLLLVFFLLLLLLFHFSFIFILLDGRHGVREMQLSRIADRSVGVVKLEIVGAFHSCWQKGFCAPQFGRMAIVLVRVVVVVLAVAASLLPLFYFLLLPFYFEELMLALLLPAIVGGQQQHMTRYLGCMDVGVIACVGLCRMANEMTTALD